MENKIRKLLMRLGVDPAILGYTYLLDAVLLCYSDGVFLREVTKLLYPSVAKKNQTSSLRVERAMRHAIENAHDINPNMCDQLFFQPSLIKGKYTNSQFIAACVEQLKVEDDENA